MSDQSDERNERKDIPKRHDKLLNFLTNKLILVPNERNETNDEI